jgi:hypothetical protein
LVLSTGSEEVSNEERAAHAGAAVSQHVLLNTAISLFILWTMFSVGVWLAPNSPQRAVLLPIVRPYLEATGLTQNFVVFSPSVDTSNAELSALVTKTDGSTELWHYPRMSEWNLFERMFKDGYTNYVFFLHRPEFRYILPGTARFIAREVYRKDPQHPPASLQLHWDWQEIVLPPQNRKPNSGTVAFFQYKVTPEDLK